MHTHFTNDQAACPACGHKLNAASSDQPCEPVQGDLSVCIACATLLVFDADLSLLQLSKQALEELDGETYEQLMFYQSHIRSVIERQQGPLQ